MPRQIPPEADKPEDKSSAEELEQMSSDSGLPGVLVSSARRRAVEWLWPGRIPLGKITMLDGSMGIGKSTLTLDIAARVSTGAPFADCEKAAVEPGAVLLVTNEDDPSDTIRPRLEAAHANLAIVEYEPRLVLPNDMTHLDEFAGEYRQTDTPLRLVIIDPFPAFVDDSIDINNESSVMRVLAPLSKFAAKFQLSILLVRNLAKRATGPAVTWGAGSIAIIGHARSGMLLARDPADALADVRVLSWTKLNLGPLPSPLRYRIGEDERHRPVIQWLGPRIGA